MISIERREFLTGIAVAGALLSAGRAKAASGVDLAKLRQAVEGPQRTAAERARDRFRHPIETVEFLGVNDSATVVEITPGGGWWTAILAPYLARSGHYYIAQPDLPRDAPPMMVRGRQAFLDRLRNDPAIFGNVRTTDLSTTTMPPSSADFLLTFRNLHNWMEDGSAAAKLAGFYRTLKPGGIFGIEDHRGNPALAQDPSAKSGYVREDVARKMIEAAGFIFVARSDLYSNPRDTKDYPSGVWTLPPTYTLGEKDRARYEAIGEADGFLMKFSKPK